MFVDADGEAMKNICGALAPLGLRFVQVFDGVQVSMVTTFPPEFMFPSSTEATSKFPLDTK